MLRVTTELRKLRLQFSGQGCRAAWQSTADDILLWYVPLSKVLEDHQWLHLRSLEIDSLLACETGLFSVLKRHSATLRILYLRNIGLWQGSFRSLFSKLQAVLSLKNFHLDGWFEAVHTQSEAWRLKQYPSALNLQIWSPRIKEFMISWASITNLLWESRGVESMPSVRQRMKEFVLSVKPQESPVSAEDSIPEQFRRTFRATHGPMQCEDLDCSETKREVEMKWDAGLRRTLEGWEDWSESDDIRDNSGEFETDIGEREIEDFYDEFGFDCFGFNRQGFNARGIHYSTVPESDPQWRRAVNPITKVMAYRMFLREILGRIPRYANFPNLRSE